MNGVLDAAALLVTAVGLLSATAAFVAARDVRLALRVLLEFLTAAGLLRLGSDPGWPELGAAAAVVAVRRLLALGCAADGAAR